MIVKLQSGSVMGLMIPLKKEGVKLLNPIRRSGESQA